MKKYLFNGEKNVSIGDVINHKGLRLIITEEFIKENPNLFSATKIPKYFKCISLNPYTKAWTLNKVYQLIDNSNYPKEIGLNCDQGSLCMVGNWDETNIRHGNNCFVPVGKKEYKEYLIETAKTMFPIGSIVSNKNLGFDCEFEITPISKFLFREGEFKISVEVKPSHFFTVYSDGKWAEIIKKVICVDEYNQPIYEGENYSVVDVEYRKWICMAGKINYKPNRHIFKNEADANTWLNINSNVK